MDSTASASQVLRLKLCTTTPSLGLALKLSCEGKVLHRSYRFRKFCCVVSRETGPVLCALHPDPMHREVKFCALASQNYMARPGLKKENKLCMYTCMYACTHTYTYLYMHIYASVDGNVCNFFFNSGPYICQEELYHGATCPLITTRIHISYLFYPFYHHLQP